MKTVPLTSTDVEILSERLPEWSRVSVDGVDRLERTYFAPDFGTAMAFTHLLGEMADAARHHPTVLTQREHITVAWWTISTNSLTQLDVIMAERTDRLFEAILAGERPAAPPLGDQKG